MRILQIQGQVEGGGSEIHTHLLSRGLRERGHEVLICVPDHEHPQIEDMRRDGFALPRFRARLNWRGVVDLPAGLRIQRIVETERIDLVHTHLWNADMMGLIGGRLAGVPVVTTLHGPTLNLHVKRDPWVHAFVYVMANVIRRMDRRIAISHFVRRLVAADLGIPDREIDVVHNSSDFARYQQPVDRSAVRRSLGVAQEAPLIGCAAVLNPQKEPIAFLEVARRVLDVRPDCRFFWAGRGPLQDAVERRRGELGLAGVVQLLGWRPDIPELFAATDVLAFTARNEPFGRVITEAMSTGTAVVAFDSGACSEILADGVTGFLARDGDVPAFAERCLRLLGDADLRRRIASAARKRVLEYFDVARFVDETEAILVDTLGRHRAGRRTRSRFERN